MKMDYLEKGDFSKTFGRQLHSLLEKNTRISFLKYQLALPGNSRYPYTDLDALYQETLETFLSFFPLGAKIVYILPNSTDDHYIIVGVLVKVYTA